MAQPEKNSGSTTRSLTDDLEEKARQLLQSERRGLSQWSPRWMIEDEIALIMDQIEGLKKLEEEVREELLASECEMGTELLQMEQRTPRYSPYRFPEREKIHRRLDSIRSERRRIRVGQAEKLDRLHERLLGLVGKWRHLAPPERHLS